MSQIGKHPDAVSSRLKIRQPTVDTIGEDETKKLRPVSRSGAPPVMMNAQQVVFKKQAAEILKRYQREQTATRAGVLTGVSSTDIFDVPTQNVEEIAVMMLRFTLNFPTAGIAPQFTIPAPSQLFQQINFLPAKTGTEGDLGKPIGETLTLALQALPREALRYLKRLGIDDHWNCGATLVKNVPQEFVVPIFGTILSQPDVSLRHIFRDDLRIEIVWKRDVWTQRAFTTDYTTTTAAADAALVELTDMQLEFQTIIHNEVNEGFHRAKLGKPLAIAFYDPVIINDTRTLTAGDTQEFVLSGMVGHFAAIFMWMSASASTNSRGNLYGNLAGWQELALLDSGGQNIQGGLTTTFNHFHEIIFPQHFASGGEFINHHRGLAGIIIAENLGLAIGSGQDQGLHFFTGDEKMSVRLKSAGTSAILRVFHVVSSTGAASAAAGATGSVQFGFYCPLSKRFGLSVAINLAVTTLQAWHNAFTENPAFSRHGDVDFAINGGTLQTAGNTVLGTAIVGNFDIRFSGVYKNLPITTANLCVFSYNCINATPAATAFVLTNATSIVQAGVDGHTTGTFNTRIIGLRYCHGIASLKQMGQTVKAVMELSKF